MNTLDEFSADTLGGLKRGELNFFDLHVHSKYSFDSLTSLDSIVGKAGKIGLHGFALTDHDSFAGAEKAAKLAEDACLVFIPGMEIETECGDLIALFLNEPVAARSFASAVDEVKAQGGVAVVAHPFKRIGKESDFKASMLPLPKGVGVEAANGRISLEKNELAIKTASRFNFFFTAGSDAHFSSEMGSAFLASKAGDAEELRKAIVNKQCAPVWVGRRYNPLSRGIRLAKRITRI